jgi:4-aminobutyrate aminotransferase/(S)-3-amino-2-methylpropionate transaminase
MPEIRAAVPGPRSRELAGRLARVECPEVTCTGEAPPFWERAAGANVWDVDGNRFVDLAAGFGVAALGYAHPRVTEAIARQAAELPHAMGDLYPARVKVELLEALERLLPGDLGSAILSGSGSDAIESALKTALVATGRAGVIAFEGAYHGLGLGALDATHRAHFRAPFAARLAGRTRFAPFGDARAVRELLADGNVGAILVEPIQGRGGVRVPPPGFLAGLRALADGERVLLVADEIYTGLGRTGHWLACEAEGVLPDVVAIGKALGAGFPISACAGRRAVMRRWAPSRGEAVHTSTHLGSPIGCAAALATIAEIGEAKLLERAREVGSRAIARLREGLRGVPGVADVRGRGLLIGIELDAAARARACAADALGAGWILGLEGDDARVIALSPPLNVDAAVLDAGLDWLVKWLCR